MNLITLHSCSQTLDGIQSGAIPLVWLKLVTLLNSQELRLMVHALNVF